MVKITDVARHAGVSPSTVSYALNGKRPISEATRRRIEASIRELGYHPHAGARALAGARSHVLALVMPLRRGVDLPVVTRFAMSVVTTARRHGHDVLLLTGEEGEDGLRRVADSARADGFVVMDVQLDDRRLPLLRALRRPSVLIGLPADPAGLTCVDLDFRAAGEACVEHLALLGHRRVALLGSPPEVYARGTGYARRVADGVTAAAGRNGLTASVHPCASDPGAAPALVRRLLGADPAPTGLVVHNEALLGPLADALRAEGVRVPEDLSVVALCPDDLAERAATPLTSVSVPAAELGARAVELLIGKLGAETGPAPGLAAPDVTLLPPRLTVRSSTAPRG
ncbi:LacI family DNA-binding transcriptional regulator [Streptomyces zingiberis]|uniref:LacI family DNA-binding transcriptional regulator n=1 Tax=Streptomyces zingiberis TaxID=2053010 RepID=UPI0028935E83|nr:LacI family DNA-binding transcriptional regulator [Streptomyces zingiberis]